MTKYWLLAVMITGAWLQTRAQVNFTKFEYNWCKPHPKYKTSFANTKYETASIPVSFNQSAEVTGLKTFYHIALTNPKDSAAAADEIFRYYKNCFDGFVDTLFFEGPTLCCMRLCKHQMQVYVSIQYANDGQAYYLTVIEAARNPINLTSEAISNALEQNKPVTVWLTNVRNDTALHEPDRRMLREFAKCLKQHPDWNINIEAHTDGEGERFALVKESRVEAAFYFGMLVKYGVDRSRVSYSGLGPDFPLESNNTCRGRAMNNRLVITRK